MVEVGQGLFAEVGEAPLKSMLSLEDVQTVRAVQFQKETYRRLLAKMQEMVEKGDFRTAMRLIGYQHFILETWSEGVSRPWAFSNVTEVLNNLDKDPNFFQNLSES